MSDPRYRVERRLDAPADAVLDVIRAAIAATGTTEIPPHLRRASITGLTGRVRAPLFSIRLVQSSDGDVTELVGQAVAAVGGGCLVQASVVDDRDAPTLVFFLLVVAAVVAVAGGGQAWWIAGSAAFIGFVAWVRRAAGAINHDEARFLAQWLDGVLDRVPAPPRADGRGMPDQPGRPSAAS